jgi:hypothetical protein
VQSSLAPRANQKLSFKFFGPFKILDKVGSVAYKLEVPSSASIHPVFHVSQLNKVVPSSSQVSDLLPDLSDAWQVLEQILAKKMVSRGSSSVQQVLVKWSGWPEALATWEDSEALYHRFPAAPAWGQAGSLRGGDVNTSDRSQKTVGPRRSTRPTVPSVRISGPDWSRPV